MAATPWAISGDTAARTVSAERYVTRREDAMKKLFRIGALLALLATAGKFVMGRRGHEDEEA